MAFYTERRKREKRSDWILSQALLLKTVLRRSHRTEVCISDLASENRNSNRERYITYVAKGQTVTQRKTIFYSLQPQGGGKEKCKECCKEGQLEHTDKTLEEDLGVTGTSAFVVCSPPQGLISQRVCSSPSISEPDRSSLIKPQTNHGCKFAKLIPGILTLEDFILKNILNI